LQPTHRSIASASASPLNASGPSCPDSANAYAAFVWRTLRHLGIPDRDIEDVTQEVFIVVHRKLPGFEGRSRIRTWIYGICQRTASDYRRRAYVRREQPTSQPPLPNVDPEQENQLRLAERQRTLILLLDQLDDKKREVFVLHEIEELEMKEVAEAIGTPLQTAYSRLRSARQLLAEAVARLREEERQ
jgi:RNA polymerase sigma-70 factor (ECF subfamily)